uniref:Eukaryotic elongation factor 2 kinase n=1 Tax=Heterorhabditis bacteriophora TaxID=37862 RepID=A0A1I7X4D7_HETBA
MDRSRLIQALHATTLADGQKQAGAFLDQLMACMLQRTEPVSPIVGTSRGRTRTTTSSSDGADWRNLCLLTNEDDHDHAKLQRESSITPAKREKPFARGAMRECYRLKKLSTLAHVNDWQHAHNYVAKKYIQEVDRCVLFEDVKLQMDAKLWAEEFNRYDPPKKIDIVQMCVLEVIDLPGEPLFHLEHFIEGDYIKYNSNSGFVSEVARKTPQAFSHFTFERSGHQMIVVDVQGVGDLYTDPQIHTVVGTDYGDGNLGTRGMALFFHSHMCNDICHSLCLTEFDLSDIERKELEQGSYIRAMNQSTMFSRQANPCSAIVPDLFKNDAMECLRLRTLSIRSRTSSASGNSHQESRCSEEQRVHDDDCVCEECLAEVTAGVNIDSFVDADDDGNDNYGDDDHPLLSEDTDVDSRISRKVGFHSLNTRCDRQRYDSIASSIGTSSLGSSSRLTRETEREEYWNIARKQSIPAGVISAIELQKLSEESSRLTQHASILGQIHLDLARYHELGRFLPEEDNEQKKVALGETNVGDEESLGKYVVKYDRESALYHLDVARRCGVLEAILTVAQMAFGLPHELLKDIGDDENWDQDGQGVSVDREEFAFELMETAAEMGDRGAMLFVAESYETGRRMGASGKPSYPDSIKWYQKAVGFNDDDDGEGTLKPRYEVLAKMAEMYQEGGCGLSQDFERAYNLYNEAAEVAIEAMKGKLANKYYEQAEMCCTNLVGFAPELLKIACDATVADTIRQAAVIYFKNVVVKFWEYDDDDEVHKKEHGDFQLAEQDKIIIKNNILDAVCVASDSTRIQLCTAAQQVMRTEYPEKWTNLLAGIQQKLNTPDGCALQGALLMIYRLSKVYEYKRAKDRQPLVDAMGILLPIMLQHFRQLLPNQSQEAVTIQKLILKIFYSLVQFSLNLHMVSVDAMDSWLEAIREVLIQPCPKELESIEDKEERAHMVWWKCKKWAAKILDRVFERYGAPGQVESGYAEFANHFLQKFSIPCVETMLQILNDQRQGIYVSDRVQYSYSFSYLQFKRRFMIINFRKLLKLFCSPYYAILMKMRKCGRMTLRNISVLNLVHLIFIHEE